MEKRSVDSYDLSCEVAGVAAVLVGLKNIFDEKSDRLNDEYGKMALSGIASYLERLADDIAEL